ncbi:hypothetical protein KCP76_20860 [Salmonella enterica subsp. enterica serovar Weltevreden]|nr:hypothetical protein KCP76_20860 [Salmonella enterica subsp. enterica serovar Weltevreden]
MIISLFCKRKYAVPEDDIDNNSVAAAISAQYRSWARAMNRHFPHRWRKHNSGHCRMARRYPGNVLVTRRVMLRYPAAPSLRWC